jgi:CDP-glucose 4,6-dehydratase
VGSSVTAAPCGVLPDPEFWLGRRVLLTGHTGFKGSWLTCWLRQLGAEVMGISLPEPPTEPSLWDQLDLRDIHDHRADIVTNDWTGTARDFDPEVVLHLAAQSLVSVGYDQPARTYEVNVLGTVRVLDLLTSLSSLVATLVITTDKVYDPSQPPPHDETHRLTGREPHSASKAAAEMVVAGWPNPGPGLATARAGNVIGGGDWAADRLLPDLVRAWEGGRAPVLRRPQGIRPWQHVLEPLRGYLVYAEALARRADVSRALNFGPADQQSVRVSELVPFAAEVWQRLGRSLPGPAWTESADAPFEETGELTLDSRRAYDEIGWASVLDWRSAVSLTLEWYAGADSGVPASELISSQLASYSSTIGRSS